MNMGCSYAFSENLSVTFLEFLDFVQDFLFELDVANVNMLREFLDGRLHGFSCAEDGAMRSEMFIWLLVYVC